MGIRNWGSGIALGHMVGFASCMPADALVHLLVLFIYFLIYLCVICYAVGIG